MKSLKSLVIGQLLITASILTLTSDYVNAAASLSNISFGQLDWFDDNGLLHTANSSWGIMDMTVIPDATDIYYLNVVGNAGNGSNWLIQNMPILSADFGEDSRQSVDFNIADLGLISGTNLPNLDVFFSVDLNPLSTAPTGFLSNLSVDDVVQMASGGLLESFPIDIGEPAGQKALGAVTKILQHKNVPGVQEGVNQCLPGAFGRSIGWLNQEYTLGVNKTSQQIFNDLLGLKIGSEFYNKDNNTYETMVGNKSKYLKNIDKQAVTKVLDLDNRLGNIPGVKEETGTDLIDWLYRELTTEDVELDYGHHVVTIAGIYMQDGMTYVKYRDDENQGDPNKGDTEEKRGKLTKKDNKYFFRKDPEKGIPSADFQVKATISESVHVPEPSTIFALGLVAGLGIFSRKRKSS